MEKKEVAETIAHKYPGLVPGVDWFFVGDTSELGAWPAGLDLPTDADATAASVAVAARTERAWRDGELLKADIEVNKAADTASATEPAWRQYREALRNWPQSAEFPDRSGRPTPPAGDPA